MTQAKKTSRRKKIKAKRVLILSDLHCGHILGLTHPEYFNHFREIQAAGWSFFTKNIKALGHIDLCIINGDTVDGEGKKDSRQHITTDSSLQQKIAIRCLSEVKAERFVFLRGTPYHVTTDMELEDGIADYFNAEIHDSRKIDVNGCVIHARHTAGKGGTAYGSATSLQRSAVVQMLNDVECEEVKADIFIRSHIHEYNLIERELYTAITTPCLQFKGTSYGRQCTGFYSFGFIWLDIRGKHDYDIHKVLLKGANHKKESVTKL